MLATPFGQQNNPILVLQDVLGFQPLTSATNTQITLTAVKEQLRILSVYNTVEDSYLTTLINTVLDWFENTYGWPMLTTSYVGTISTSTWTNFRLNKNSINSIISVSYYPADWNTVDAITVLPATFQLQTGNGMETANTYTLMSSGYNQYPTLVLNNNYALDPLYILPYNIQIAVDTTPLTIPPRLQQALLMHIVYLYINRGDIDNLSVRKSLSFSFAVYEQFRVSSPGFSSFGLSFV